MHKAAEISLAGQADAADRLEHLVLARIASAARGVDRGVIAADLAPFAGPQMPASRWRGAVEDAIGSLLSRGMIAAKPGGAPGNSPAGFVATPAGTASATRFLGAPAHAALAWDHVCSIWLVAKALGVRKTTPKRMAVLATADGLRAAILVQAYGLSFKGEATPARLRHALAAAALRRAFGGQSATGLANKLGLSARASRLLAAQLLDKPRDPGTDRRLVAALAAQACGVASADLGALRAAVLRRLLAPSAGSSDAAPALDARHGASRAGPSALAPRARARGERIGDGKRAEAAGASDGGSPATSSPSPQWDAEPARAHRHVEARPSAAAPVASPPAASGAAPPDLPGFASEVRRCAAGEAQGWSGDRKAYISRVWRSLRERRPEWGLSEIEFKGMLAEAHRAGQLALANADLKDESNIKDVQDSALVYKNAVFHFIRVDA